MINLLLTIKEGYMNIGIYIYDDAEVLDFSGPFEVFSIAKRLSENKWNIFLIAETKQTINARGGFHVTPHFDIKNHPNIDILIVAGGDHKFELSKSHVIEWINNVSNNTKYTLSVCTGAFLLAEARLLKNRMVTTHWEDIVDLRVKYSDLTVVDDKRWVKDGKFITSAGISAGIDMSLAFIADISSTALAIKTARQMDYNWQYSL